MTTSLKGDQKGDDRDKFSGNALSNVAGNLNCNGGCLKRIFQNVVEAKVEREAYEKSVAESCVGLEEKLLSTAIIKGKLVNDPNYNTCDAMRLLGPRNLYSPTIFQPYPPPHSPNPQSYSSNTQQIIHLSYFPSPLSTKPTQPFIFQPNYFPHLWTSITQNSQIHQSLSKIKPPNISFHHYNQTIVPNFIYNVFDPKPCYLHTGQPNFMQTLPLSHDNFKDHLFLTVLSEKIQSSLTTEEL